MWIEKHGKTWRIRETVGDQKVTLVGGLPSKTAANAHLITLRADAVRGDFVDPRQGKTKLREMRIAGAAQRHQPRGAVGLDTLLETLEERVPVTRWLYCRLLFGNIHHAHAGCRPASSRMRS